MSEPNAAGRVASREASGAEPVLDLVAAAQAVAAAALREIDDHGRRWAHTRAVAARAAQAAATFSEVDAATLLAAAWMHDIGYAPSFFRYGFHPLDGAIHIRDDLPQLEVAGLVAHHSGARFIASVLGLDEAMREFSAPSSWAGPLADALTWADQTTGADGRTVTVEERLLDMLARHGPDSPAARCHAVRAPALIAAVRATESRLLASGVEHPREQR